MNDVTNFACRKRLVFLKQHASSLVDVKPDEEIVVLSQDKTVSFASIGHNGTVIGTETKRINIADPFNVVVEFL